MKLFSTLFLCLVLSMGAQAQSSPAGIAPTQPNNIGPNAVITGDSALGTTPIPGTGVAGTPTQGAPTVRMPISEKKPLFGRRKKYTANLDPK